MIFSEVKILFSRIFSRFSRKSNFWFKKRNFDKISNFDKHRKFSQKSKFCGKIKIEMGVSKVGHFLEQFDMQYSPLKFRVLLIFLIFVIEILLSKFWRKELYALFFVQISRKNPTFRNSRMKG